MTIKEILNTTKHRPWQIPNSSWKFYQEWNNALFLHWQVDLNELKKLVPKELEIDLFEGKAWVSVVPFTMEQIRPKNLPPFPPISNFNEINIRTYVRFNDKTGVYFLSIEGGKLLSCLVSKTISELPYRYSKMSRSEGQYLSHNSSFGDDLEIEFSLGNKLNEKSALDKWLTERYALFQDTKKCINEFEIHHLEWPMNEIVVSKLNFNYPRFNQLIKGKPDLIQYSKGVKVIAWGKVKNRKNK